MRLHFWAFPNMPKKYFWNAISHMDRHTTINDIEKVVLKYGFIIDHHMFSDMEMSFTIEIQERRIKKLYSRLKKHIRLIDPDIPVSGNHKESILYLHLSFSKSKGKLEIEIPAVPG